jgi:protein-S-isoprenylcysteine O-methyltransferase Ste14
MTGTDQIAEWTFFAVIACWFAFAAIFIFRKRPPKARESKRERVSSLGIFLQAIAYFLVWTWPLHRRLFTPISPMRHPAEVGLSVLTVAIAIASVWLVSAAVRTLGKQWAVSARLVHGHQLITDGPYRLARNPIYTGMLGMLLATGLAISRWSVLAIASAIFIFGAYIRIRAEERLLRAAFGAEFERYAERVPAFLPGIY